MAAQDKIADDIIDLPSLVARLVARWRLVTAIIAVFTVGFAAAAFLMTPVYRSTVVLAPASQESSGRGLLNSAIGDLGGVAALAGINIGSLDPQTEEALAVLKSRELTEAFVSDWGLMPRLFERRWDAKNKTWRRGLFGLAPPPSPAKAFDKFEHEIRTVTSDRKTGLVTLQIDWRDRDEAAAWANELVRRVNTEMRARAIAQAEASMAYLEKETPAAQTVTARDALSRLMESQIKVRMVANVSPQYAFRVVDKAMPADPDDPVRPNKLVQTIIGFLVGGLVAIAVVMSGSRAAGASRSRGPTG